MDNYDIKSLKQLSEYLEISKRDFEKILALAICYRKSSNEYIPWELLCHLIEETMINMDYEVTNENIISNNKTTIEAFKKALSNLGYNWNKKNKIKEIFMRNDVQIKVTCLTTNNKDEFHFDYYDKDGKIVGTVAVDETGKLGWTIWNNEYKESVLSTASFIFGLKVDNTMKDILLAREAEKVRWERAQDYINSRGLYVNYLQNYFEKEFNNRPVR